MDLNELYRSISGFWETVAPVFIAHVIALFAIRWIGGGRTNILPYLEYLIKTETYQRWAKLFDEFNQKSKIPYLIVITLLVYFVVFNSALDLVTIFEPLKITYSELEFWEENRPVRDLAKIGSYGKSVDTRIWEIAYLKNNFLEKYKSLYPSNYNSSISWHSREYSKWFTYYQLSIVFLVFSVIVFTIRVFKRRWNKSIYARLFLLILLSAVGIGFTRYKAEQCIESRLKAEISFVTTQLNVDTQAQESKLSEQEIQTLQTNMFNELKHFDQKTIRIDWFSRILERYSIGNRSFPFVSDDEFYEMYSNFESKSTSP